MNNISLNEREEGIAHISRGNSKETILKTAIFANSKTSIIYIYPMWKYLKFEKRRFSIINKNKIDDFFLSFWYDISPGDVNVK